MNSASRLLLAVALLASASGCYGRAGHGAGLVFGGAALGAAIASSSYHAHQEMEQPVYVTNVYYVNGPAPGPTPPSRRDRVEADEAPRPFDASAARAALNAIDVAGCRAAGAPRGYGHAKITFNPDGTASKVVVDEPTGLPADAAKCVGDRLGTATVPEFKGSLVVMGATWYVP